MNIQKFTQKSLEAMKDCEKLAYQHGNQDVDQEHLLVALLELDDSLIRNLLEKMDKNVDAVLADAKAALDRVVKVHGDVQIRIGQGFNKVVLCAEDEAKPMGDAYVSVEHIFLALIKYANNSIKNIFTKHGITRDAFLKALAERE